MHRFLRCKNTQNINISYFEWRTSSVDAERLSGKTLVSTKPNYIFSKSKNWMKLETVFSEENIFGRSPSEATLFCSVVTAVPSVRILH